MKIYTVVLLFVSLPVLSLEIEGRWASSKKLSMDYNSQYATLTKDQILFLSQVMGTLALDFDDGLVAWTIQNHAVKVDDKKFSVANETKTYSYKTVGEDSDTVFIRTVSEDGQVKIFTYNFEDENKMWLYLPSTDRQFDHLHIREYFERVK